MPQQLNDPVVTAFAAGTMLLSVATGLYLLAAWSRGPVLRFLPRAFVPWNAAGAVLAFVLVLVAVGSALVGHTAPQHDVEEKATQVAPQLINYIVQEVIVVGGVLFFVAVYFNATRRDLGLSSNPREFAHDVMIGLVAGLAALAPVRLIQGLLLYCLGTPEMQSGHPLVQMLVDGEPNLIVMLLAAFAVVVVAPVCEEITFRLLLQGWLEKWEAERLGWHDEPSLEVNASGEVRISAADSMTNDEAQMTNEGTPDSGDSSFVFRHSSLDSPPQRGIAGWPFGWLPIAVSSLLFGLAHFGYGPEPISLFFLSLLLGYVYQRTHRIVPCIVAHALFNLFTVVVLWWMVFHGAK